MDRRTVPTAAPALLALAVACLLAALSMGMPRSAEGQTTGPTPIPQPARTVATTTAQPTKAASTASAQPTKATPTPTGQQTKPPGKPQASVSAPAPLRARAVGAVMTLLDTNGQDGCTVNYVPRNDDGSSPQITLPFAANFFGTSYTGLYVNNNGNVTFDQAMSTFTPFGLLDTSRVVIASYFADIDTREGASALVTYGATTYSGRPAFCANWVGVGYYDFNVDKLLDAQLVLVDRSDVGAGDFDIIMNYDRVQWETGDVSGGTGGLGGTSAVVGYSSGTTAFELPGSLVPGSFLDSNAATGLIYNSRNSTQPGRYVYSVRNGAAPMGDYISGTVYANSVAAGNALGGALVQVCPDGGACSTTATGTSGQFQVTGLAPGQYKLRAFPPAGSNLQSGVLGPITLAAGLALPGQDIVLRSPLGPPTGTSITHRGVGANGVPVVHWNDTLSLTAPGCSGGTATYDIRQGGASLRTGSMVEIAPGSLYHASIAPLNPWHGNAQISIAFTCPAGGATPIAFDIYVDPSGLVRTVGGDPLQGATVTLFRSDASTGPFVAVTDGSAVMSAVNRRNPDTTDAAGRFGWDVFAGFYRVRAEKAGYHAPGNPAQPYVESAVLPIPPQVTNLDLRLESPATTTSTPTAAATATSTGTPTAVATATATSAPTITPTPTPNIDVQRIPLHAGWNWISFAIVSDIAPAGTPVRTGAFRDYHGTVSVGGQDAPQGATVEAFSPRGDLVGSFTVTRTGNFGYMRVYGQDPQEETLNPAIPGMLPGEEIAFKVNGHPVTTDPPSLTWTSGFDPLPVDVQAGLGLPVATWLNDSLGDAYDFVLGEEGTYAVVPPYPGANRLTQLEPGRGYFLRMTRPGELVVRGRRLMANRPMQLPMGWHWLGYLPQEPGQLPGVLGSVGGLYDYLLGEMGTFAPFEAPFLNSLHAMETGRGYLIRMRQAGVLTYMSGAAPPPVSTPTPAP